MNNEEPNDLLFLHLIVLLALFVSLGCVQLIVILYFILI